MTLGLMRKGFGLSSLSSSSRKSDLDKEDEEEVSRDSRSLRMTKPRLREGSWSPGTDGVERKGKEEAAVEEEGVDKNLPGESSKGVEIRIITCRIRNPC